MRDRDRLALVLILALGAALRLFHLDAAFLDTHAWRQLDTAAMARNFYEGSFIPLRSASRLGRPPGISRGRVSARAGGDRGCLSHRWSPRHAGPPGHHCHQPGAHLGGLSPVARARWPPARGPRRGLSDGGVSDGRLLRPYRDSGHADGPLHGDRARRFRRVRPRRIEALADCRRRVLDYRLPAQAAGGVRGPRDRHRHSSRPEAGASFAIRWCGCRASFRWCSPAPGTGTRTRFFCALA